MDCQERNRLLSEYSSAVLEASRDAKTLSNFAGITALADYTLLLRQHKIAKSRAMRARAVYEHHVTTHRCKIE